MRISTYIDINTETENLKLLENNMYKSMPLKNVSYLN